MTALAVIVGILLLFFLIGQVRLGGAVEYSEAGVAVQVRLGFWKWNVYPPKEKAEKKEKKSKEKDPKEPKGKQVSEEPDEKRGGKLTLFKELLPLVLEAVGTLKRKIRIDLLILHLIWGAEDPASAAMGYGAANAAMGMIYPVLDQNFNIKKSDVGINVDFQRSEPEIYLNAVLTLTVGQLIALVLHYGLRAILIYMKQREKPSRTNKKKEAVTDE